MSPSKFLQLQTYMIEFEEEGIKHVKMFIIITLAYIIFWGPLFLVTLINISLDWKDAKSSVSHEVSKILGQGMVQVFIVQKLEFLNFNNNTFRKHLILTTTAFHLNKCLVCLY